MRFSEITFTIRIYATKEKALNKNDPLCIQESIQSTISFTTIKSLIENSHSRTLTDTQRLIQNIISIGNQYKKVDPIVLITMFIYLMMHSKYLIVVILALEIFL